MKVIFQKRVFAHLFLLCLCLFAPALSSASTVTVEIIHSRDRYPAGGSYPLMIRLQIADSWFLHGVGSEDQALIPTRLSIRESGGLKVTGIRFPAPEERTFSYASGPLEVFSGFVLGKATLEVDGGVPPGRRAVQGKIIYQA